MTYFNAFQNSWNPSFGGIFGTGLGGVGFPGFSGLSQGLFGNLARSMMGYSAGLLPGSWGWGFPGQDYGQGFQGYGQGFGHHDGYGYSGHGAYGCGHHGYGQHGYGNHDYGHHGYGHDQGHHGCHGHSAPREGTWSSAKGGYVVGQSGQINVNVKQGTADNNNNLQYRVGEGPWQDIGSAKDTGQETSVHAPPGSTVQFRIQTPQGDSFQAGTTRNADGIDHGRVSAGQHGAVLGFEDLRGGGDQDFDDAVIEITDGRRRAPETKPEPEPAKQAPAPGSFHWDPSTNTQGWMVGERGKLDVAIGTPTNYTLNGTTPTKSGFQYRVNGGAWQELGNATSIEAPQGSLVQFQVKSERMPGTAYATTGTYEAQVAYGENGEDGVKLFDGLCPDFR